MRKSILTWVVVGALAAVPVSAIQVTFNEDSVTRNWFNVVWGASPSAPLEFITSGGFSDGGAMDMTTSVRVDHINPIQPGTSDPTPFFDNFTIAFAAGSRLFSTATVSGFAGTSVLPIVGEIYGTQVLYGRVLPSTGVPDGGVTAALLGVAIAGLLGYRHKLAGDDRS